ncbi:MAG TPA: prolipoprotein diacylglyceryl transferase [Pyrinomonadaceae bacterium]|nr:prolipoprotein diacylglyceryl transferase [Pyrinomonadaceae bacterium]
MSYTHDIDPVIGTVLGVHLWWYGFSYTLGFFNAFRFIGKRRSQLSLNELQVYELTILIATGVLIGGRVVEVIFYEWPFYGANLELIPAFWLGGMASHGLLLGGLAAVWIFCRIYNKPFLMMTDALAAPASFILGAGRIGNFIDGQILGSVTDVAWAVKFPDAEGFRHPVVLYDGIKNILIIPVLLFFGRGNVPHGFVTGLFLFLYSFLRIPVDIFREYPTSLLGLATGQALNIALSVVGLAIITSVCALPREEDRETGMIAESTSEIGWRKPVLVALLLFCLVMPSDWTQDVPERYGKRHRGLTHSPLYPPLSTSD